MTEDAAMVLQPYLLPKERLLWSGRPAKYFIYQWVPHIYITITGLLITIFALDWIQEAAKTSYIFAAFGLLFVFIGFYMAIGYHLHITYLRKVTVFGITNQRILFVEKGFSIYITEYSLKNIDKIRYKMGKNDLGTVFFTIKKGAAPNRDPKVRPVKITEIEQIADTLTVYQLLEDLKNKPNA